MFEILYKKIIGVNFCERKINYLYESVMRKDIVYETLVKKYYNNKIALNKILLILEKININTTTELSFLAYVYALNNKWLKAIETIEIVIKIEKGENIDSWIDYGHFLRKIIIYENLSNKLLLNLEYFMNKYKNEGDYDKSIIEFLNQIDC